VISVYREPVKKLPLLSKGKSTTLCHRCFTCIYRHNHTI